MEIEDDDGAEESKEDVLDKIDKTKTTDESLREEDMKPAVKCTADEEYEEMIRSLEENEEVEDGMDEEALLGLDQGSLDDEANNESDQSSESEALWQNATGTVLRRPQQSLPVKVRESVECYKELTMV
jgi:hypothetical protein